MWEGLGWVVYSPPTPTMDFGHFCFSKSIGREYISHSTTYTPVPPVSYTHLTLPTMSPV